MLAAFRHEIAANPRNFVFVSAISIVEIATIKESIGKQRGPDRAEGMLDACRFHELALTIGHASALRSLPLIHKDPFDRLLIAQAHVAKMTIVTRDPLFSEYEVPLVTA